MTQDLDSGRIANAAIEPEKHEEIEITDEMLAAGAEAFFAYEGLEFGTGETAAYAIFTAMAAASPRLRNLVEDQREELDGK
jgi:hypothetical protein